MKLALSQTCTMTTPLEEDFSACADASGAAVELWLTKVEEYLKDHSREDVLALAKERNLSFAAGAYQGGILFAQGEARKVAWELFEKRLDLCRDLGVPTLIIVPDPPPQVQMEEIQRGQVSLKQAGQEAEKRGVRLALEFQAKGTFLNNLETAASFILSVEQPNVGICLDAFHFFTGPSKYEDLQYLNRDNLFHVELCDLADTPRELATDSHRILPGDGDFPLSSIVARLREIDYQGYVSLETWNPTFWQIPAQQVCEIGMTALRVAVGMASRERKA